MQVPGRGVKGRDTGPVLKESRENFLKYRYGMSAIKRIKLFPIRIYLLIWIYIESIIVFIINYSYLFINSELIC